MRNEYVESRNTDIGIISPGSIFLKHLYLFHILFIYMEEKFFFDVINNSYIGYRYVDS